MITFTKIKYEDIPEPIRKRVMSMSDKEIIFDDVGLTALQIQRLRDYFLQEGFKQV